MCIVEITNERTNERTNEQSLTWVCVASSESQATPVLLVTTTSTRQRASGESLGSGQRKSVSASHQSAVPTTTKCVLLHGERMRQRSVACCVCYDVWACHATASQQSQQLQVRRRQITRRGVCSARHQRTRRAESGAPTTIEWKQCWTASEQCHTTNNNSQSTLTCFVRPKHQRRTHNAVHAHRQTDRRNKQHAIRNTQTTTTSRNERKPKNERQRTATTTNEVNERTNEVNDNERSQRQRTKSTNERSQRQRSQRQ